MRALTAVVALVISSASCATDVAPNASRLPDEAFRQEVFVAWMEAGLRIEREARGLESASENPEDLTRDPVAGTVVRLYDESLAAVAEEFGIDKVEVIAIQVEGIARGWPRPEPDR